MWVFACHFYVMILVISNSSMLGSIEVLTIFIAHSNFIRALRYVLAFYLIMGTFLM